MDKALKKTLDDMCDDLQVQRLDEVLADPETYIYDPALTREELTYRACNESCPRNEYRCLLEEGHDDHHRAPDGFDSTGVVITAWLTWPKSQKE